MTRRRSTAPGTATGREATGMKVAYVMSRFPKLSETFVLYELLAVGRQGVTVELYPLLREREAVMHPEAAPLVEAAHYQPFLSWAILRSNLGLLLRRPVRYLRTFAALLAGVWGSVNFTAGALGIWPKVVHMAGLMAADGVAHVHCHFANHPAAAGWIIHRLVGIPYSFTAHGSDLHVDRHMLPQKVAESAFAVTVSALNRQVILDTCGDWASAKVSVLHCGVDTDVFRPRPRHEADNGRVQSLRILCVGTLHEVKGQRYLLEACRLLSEQKVPYRATLVGDGPDRAALAALVAQHGLADAVELAGGRTRDQIVALLAATDVLVAPSVPTQQGKREGIPVVLMEAMGAGVAVVASRLSGIPELVAHERDGLLTPPRDASALAAALARLYYDRPLRDRLAAAGRARVVEEFNLHTNAARLAEWFSLQGERS